MMGCWLTIDLLSGQRKRLALVSSSWTNGLPIKFGPLCVGSTRYILPELKARGKNSLAITYDDRYFSWAERLVKLQDNNLLLMAMPDLAQCSAAHDCSL